MWWRLRISFGHPVTMWGYSSTSELFRVPEWLDEKPNSGQESSEERSPVGSRFSELLFLNVPGTVTEQGRTCGFKRKSSSLDKTPKMRHSVLLNFFESFLVTLPSIFSETWEINSWASSGSSVFCDRLFPVLSGVSFDTAPNFLSFFLVAMILRKKFCQQRRMNWSFFCSTMMVSSLFWGTKV